MAENIRNATVTISAAQSTEVGADFYGDNVQRAFISIANLEPNGGNVMYLSVGDEAAANKGTPLSPGQTYTESMDAGYKPSNRKFTIYCAAGSSVAVQERLLVRGA